MGRLLGQELVLLDLLGGRTSLTVREALNLLFLKRSLLYLGLSIVALFAADPPGLRAYMAIWQAAATWPVSLISYLCLFLGQLVLYGVASLRFPRLLCPTPLVSLVALVPTVVLAENMAFFMSGGIYPIDLPGKIAFFYITVQVFDTVFIRFVIPQMLPELRRAEPAPAQVQPLPEKVPEAVPETDALGRDPQPNQILVAGERLPLDRIRHIEAREHFVLITLDDGAFERRARLSDIVAQFDDSHGVQPHRSWWVSRRAVAEVTRDGGRPMLRLTDDTLVPVARGRHEAVMGWLDALAAE